jgi:hypothetical protein
MKVPLCTIGKACLRILHGILDGIWVDREIGKHVLCSCISLMRALKKEMRCNIDIFPLP